MKISLENVTKAFGGLRALDRVSLDIEPGQIVALLGPNGAGKTTLLRCLAGILASSGTVRFDGEPFHRGRLDLRRRLFFLSDVPLVYPEMTVLRHIGMVLRLYGADAPGAEEKVAELMREFELLPLVESKLGRLSRGQLYKTALIAFLAVDPELWMIDEPFGSGMDPMAIMAFKRRTREAVARGGTVLYTTQILEVAEGFSDRVCVLHRGEVRAFDSVSRLRERLGAKGGVLEGIFRSLSEESR